MIEYPSRVENVWPVKAANQRIPQPQSASVRNARLQNERSDQRRGSAAMAPLDISSQRRPSATSRGLAARLARGTAPTRWMAVREETTATNTMTAARPRHLRRVAPADMIVRPFVPQTVDQTATMTVWAGQVSICISSVKSGGLYDLSYQPNGSAHRSDLLGLVELRRSGSERQNGRAGGRS